MVQTADREAQTASGAGLTHSQARNVLWAFLHLELEVDGELIEIGECVKAPDKVLNYYEFQVVHPPIGTAIVLTSGPVLLPINS